MSASGELEMQRGLLTQLVCSNSTLHQVPCNADLKTLNFEIHLEMSGGWRRQKSKGKKMANNIGRRMRDRKLL